MIMRSIKNVKGARKMGKKDLKNKKTELKFVFVHGLSGWGNYDRIDKFFPYWGLSGGSIIKYLRREGYDCYAASVSPTGSAWDRACELYAQLAGTVVDYGEEHSKRCHHERFGRDFSSSALIEDWENAKIVLLGHSFGGVTVRLFSELLINGSEAERQATKEEALSPFFRGGNKGKIFSVITLSAPTNGTTAYDMYEDPLFDVSKIEIPETYEKMGGMVSKGTRAKKDGRIPSDYAAYDMHIDNAHEINKHIETFPDVYYFAYPTSSCERREDGTVRPIPEITESMFMRSAILMSHYKGRTAGGLIIDESWQAGDGLVNEISAKAPSGAPSEIFDPEKEIRPGMWYVMPTIRGDHMYFQGGMTKRVKIRPFYLELAEKISRLFYGILNRKK